MNLTLHLSGMHCQACVGRVTAALAPLCGEVKVTLTPSQIATLTDAKVPTPALLAAVAGAGAYTAREAVAGSAPAASAAATVVAISATIPVKAKAISPALPAAQNGAFLSEIPAKNWATYFPLALLTGYLVVVPALVQWGATAFDWQAWMRQFMAAFFLSFSFFKLLNLRAFAEAYAGYDLIAKVWRGWGFVYPFVELTLGVAYLTNWNPVLTNWLTLIVMGVSLAGVIRAVASKQTIRCACLGAVFNLPMSTVTIVEDALMVAMAGWMLLQR
jgi:copper chaperone CopZ